jgi:formimidoylglutamate deiminase
VIAWLPELVYTNNRFERDLAVVCDDAGTITELVPAGEVKCSFVRAENHALLPGMVNAHSHAFQRVIRGRTEHRTQNRISGTPQNNRDSFWTWREMMYSAATRLSPDDTYDASRMAFMEMTLTGITAVGEFHYLHHAPDGSEYDDPNLLAKEVMRAATDVGLRIALLRVAYARAGYERDPDPQQVRFIEADPQTYLKRIDELISSCAGREEHAWVGIAPHSVRAVPLAYLKEVISYGNEKLLPIHMHVAEQPAEVSACIQEHGRSPVSLLASEGLLSERFTAVHAIHVTPKAIHAFADFGAMVCACPTTERNLGDGVVPADLFFNDGVRIALGSDSHAQIDLLEDARELEYHLRLQKMERAVLSPEPDDSRSALAARLFDCATISGAESIGAPSGALVPGKAADFFTVDLNDPSIAGAGEDDLLAAIVFGLSKTAVREVVVGGKEVVSEGKHRDQHEIVERFSTLQKKLWS